MNSTGIEVHNFKPADTIQNSILTNKHQYIIDLSSVILLTFRIYSSCLFIFLQCQRGEDISYFDKILKNIGELPSVFNPQQVSE